MSIYLRTLVPGSLEIKFKKDGDAATQGLKKYICLLKIAQEAFTAFQQGNFKEFDALVGENACQIRAVKVAMIASKKLVDSDPLVKSIKQQLEKLPKELPTSAGSESEKIKSKNKDKSPEAAFLSGKDQSGKSLETLLKEEDIQLSTEAAFLLNAYICNVAKKVDNSHGELRRKEECSPDGLVQKFGAAPPNFAKKIMWNARIFLANASVRFVQDQTASLGDSHLQQMTSTEFEFGFNNNLPSLPMFWTYKTLLLAARREGIPLIFRVSFQATDKKDRQVRQSYIFLQPGEEGYELRDLPRDPSEKDRKKAAIFIDGVARAKLSDLPTNQQWKEKLSSLNLKAIFAGAAVHRQYPDEKQDFLRIIKKAFKDKEFYEEIYQEFLESQKLAQTEGFSEENPSMFFIQHVYPISLGKAVDELGAE